MAASKQWHDLQTALSECSTENLQKLAMGLRSDFPMIAGLWFYGPSDRAAAGCLFGTAFLAADEIDTEAFWDRFVHASDSNRIIENEVSVFFQPGAGGWDPTSTRIIQAYDQWALRVRCFEGSKRYLNTRGRRQLLSSIEHILRSREQPESTFNSILENIKDPELVYSH